MGYKSLSLIQVVFIILAALSVLDFGIGVTNPLGAGDGLLINKLLFDPDDGIIGPILKDIDFWGLYQYIGYCMFVVAFCQLGKALGSDKY
ncbi:MAG: hypothetical protein ACW97P_10390 [Candidatus Hodarchaeales archaeon]|jgi:hypothetical protein